MTYTYDDIQLIPKYSEIESRKNIDLTTKLTKNYSIPNPIIAAPMDTICGFEMALELANLGCVGVIHRFMDIYKQAELVYKLKDTKQPVIGTVGVGDKEKERVVELWSSGVNIFLIDVAHGHHLKVKKMIKFIKTGTSCDVIAGNIATREAALDLQEWGADALRVGIGAGSACTTRIKTGFGIPMLSCLEEIYGYSDVPIIADGGIRNSGDIAKALAFGASSVMLGSILAGTKETPGKIIYNSKGLSKMFRGSASLSTKVSNGQEPKNIEGESTYVSYKGEVKLIIEDLLDGIRSALSYAGANNLEEYKPDYVIVTNAGIQEAKPHIL